MPKDEFDFDDPMELSGVAIPTAEDTSAAMCECFVEEFLWLGYHHQQILALFRNPHYLGMNLVLQNRGEAFVREKIAEVFARWKRPVDWTNGSAERPEDPPPPPSPSPATPVTREPADTDPTGAPIPKFKL
jgi:hypothetical protein